VFVVLDVVQPQSHRRWFVGWQVEELTHQTAGEKTEESKGVADQDSALIFRAQVRLKAERVQFYERLGSMQGSPRLEEIYKLFEIGIAEKKKKTRLLEMMCELSWMLWLAFGKLFRLTS